MVITFVFYCSDKSSTSNIATVRFILVAVVILGTTITAAGIDAFGSTTSTITAVPILAVILISPAVLMVTAVPAVGLAVAVVVVIFLYPLSCLTFKYQNL